jgi:hypothetical protein
MAEVPRVLQPLDLVLLLLLVIVLGLTWQFLKASVMQLIGVSRKGLLTRMTGTKRIFIQ